MTLSPHALTLVAFIAIGLSLLAIAFVVFGGGGRRRRRPRAMAGDEAVGVLLERIERLEQAARSLNGTRPPRSRSRSRGACAASASCATTRSKTWEAGCRSRARSWTSTGRVS